MYRSVLVLPALLLLVIPVFTQQTATQKASPYAAIPVEAARQQNPVKPSPESAARAKKW